MNRYFEVVEIKDGQHIVVIEYPMDFGLWKFPSFKFKRKSFTEKGDLLIGSNFEMNTIQFNDALFYIVSEDTEWTEVNLKWASNPILERLPAMSKKAKK